jgi:hypothetical protein
MSPKCPRCASAGTYPMMPGQSSSGVGDAYQQRQIFDGGQGAVWADGWLLGALGSVTRSLWWIDVKQRSPALRYWRSSTVNVGRVHRGRIERASAALWVISTGSVLMLTYMLRG